MMNKNISVLVLWLAMSLWAKSVTIYVATNGVDSRTGLDYWTNAVLTISNAVALASATDVVLVSNGTYFLTARINVDKAITVRGFNGLTNTIVDGNYPSYSNNCFYLSASGSILDGFTIRNGCGTNLGGGGVYMSGGTLLTNCLVADNRAIEFGAVQNNGGGVYANGADALIYNCRIIGNIVDYATSNVRGGGGVSLANGAKIFNSEVISNYCHNRGGGILASTAVISNCVIMYNLATNNNVGGGIAFCSVGGLVVDCTIAMNSASSRGGGISFGNSSSASYGGSSTALNCNVYGNTANIGGGISTYRIANALIDRCSISNNVGAISGSSGDGAGVSLSSNSVIRNCLVVSNTSVLRKGGGIAAEINTIIQSCTIAGNQAVDGGGLYLSSSNNHVDNTIVWSNTATSGGSSSNIYITTSEQSNSFTYSCTTVAFTNTANRNIADYPQFLNAGGFNYRLDGNSPCINTGSNQDWMTGAFDLDGYSRIDKFRRQVDMGCYEHIPKGTMFRFH